MAWSKGQSGNPSGQHRDKPFRDALRMEVVAAGEDHKKLRAIARQLLSNAENGDIQAIKEVADRLDGKVAQTHGGDDESGPVKLVVSWEK